MRPEPPAFWIGVSVSPIEPALRDQLRIPADEGLIATEVVAEGPGAKAGLKVNDILLTMGGKPLKDQATLVDLVQKNGEKSVAARDPAGRIAADDRADARPAQGRPPRLQGPPLRRLERQFPASGLRGARTGASPGANKDSVYTYTLQNPAG